MKSFWLSRAAESGWRRAEKSLRFLRSGSVQLSFSSGRRIPFPVACILAALCLAFLAIRCSANLPSRHAPPSNSADNPIKLVFIPASGNSDWWGLVRAGAESAAREYGARVEWLAPEGGADRGEQVRLFASAMETRPDAILIAQESPEIPRLVRQAVDEGILCIAILVPCEGCALSIALNHASIGAEGMRLLAESIAGKGGVLVVSSYSRLDMESRLLRGFREVARQEYPQIRIVQERAGTTGSLAEAESVSDAMLARHSQISGVFAADRAAALGMLSALRRRGLAGAVGFVGVDSSAELIRALEKGEISALVVRNPREIGSQAVHGAMRKLRGDDLPSSVPIPFMPVDRSNLERMKIEDPGALGV